MGTPVSNVWMRLTKASYSVYWCLRAYMADRIESFLPTLRWIWSLILVKMASMLFLMLSKDAFTYFSKSLKDVMSLVLPASTHPFTFYWSRPKGVSSCKYFLALLMRSLIGRIL